LAFPSILTRLLDAPRRLLATSRNDFHRSSTCWTIRPEPPSETHAVSIRSLLVCSRFQLRARREPPLMGFIKDSLPSTSPQESTPGRAVALPSMRCMPSTALVPSLSFHPTPTVFSSCGFVGLLHPTADHGVRRVSIHACTNQVRTRRSRDLPYGACPSKLFPRK